MFEKKLIEMRNITKNILAGTLILGFTACDVLNETANVLLSTSPNGETNKLTNVEVIGGLKEALTLGITNAVDITSVTDGFFGNQEIKLPFPEMSQNFIKIRSYLIKFLKNIKK